MIRYALACVAGHEFEGWFGSSADYDEQEARGLLQCPICETRSVAKQIMAPAVAGAKRGQEPAHPMMLEAMNLLRAHVEETFDDVGDAFAAEARAIHEGRSEKRDIHGRATGKEVAALIEDGIPVAPLPPKPPGKTEIN
jgi:hypothetical protein